MKRLHLATALLLASTALVSAPALAGEATSDLARQIQALQDQLRSMQQQLDSVKANEAASKDAIAKETAAREAAEKAAKEVNLENGGRNVVENGVVKMLPPSNPKVVESGTHRFTMSSADGNWTIAPTGRIHMDLGGYLNQSPESAAGVGTNAGGKLTSGINLRRARLGVTGKAMGDFTYTLILDGGGSQDNATLINTASIGYTGIRNTIIEAGYMASFFTLDESTSSNDLIFMERATSAAVAAANGAADPRFNLGFRTWESNWWLGAYITSSKPGDVHGLTQRALAAYQRATYQIVQEDDMTVHVGVEVNEIFRAPNSGANTAETFGLSNAPELRIDNTATVNTGALGTLANPVTGATIYGAETAATLGGLFYQGEYYHYNVQRQGRTDVNFDGGYVQLAYAFGAKHTYNANCGCYGGINPGVAFNPMKGDLGVVELAARVSYINLTDQFRSAIPTTTPQPLGINGGRQTGYTAGLNWYWNSNMLWKFNYIHTDLSRATAPGAGGSIGVPAGLSIDAVGARFQVMF